MPLTEQCSEALAAFAESIVATETWQDWNNAERAMEADAAITQLFARYEEMTRVMQAAKARGGELSGEQLIELGEVSDRITNNPLYKRHEEASRQLTSLFQGINSLLSKRLSIDFAALAAPRGGCCG